ncbi:glycosyltransferase [Arthrobacter crystallopoietes BAB-32]|uniref:D-inositol 3-phosphate glycosyltransferase n=1 Tax=Arthrobacter crystallopoietes BAB-32 TaxID=1246476 RepID=N1VBJ7_9MICC|nr:glycosyltransferase [Arthrobacter crystallopoietes]EMY35673.1 glycosyltransferase [Arthrobacter crystallopoietes BAB-32]
MHILVASRIFAPEAGAAAYRLAATVKALEAAGHTVTVLTSTSPDAQRSTGRVRRWPVLRDRSGAVRGYVQYASFDIPLFFRLLSSRRFDAVLAEPPPTTGVVVRMASWLRRRPYVYFAADVSSDAAAGIGVDPRIVAVLRAVERWVLNGAASVLSVSEGVSAAVRDLTRGKAQVAEVGTGVDTGTFRPAASADGGTPGTQRTLVYAGTMSEIQGAGVFVDGFLKIMDRYPDAELLLYGQGVELRELRERAAPAGSRIRFMGLASGEETAAALGRAAAGLASVRPGRGYDFAFATKAFASLACGTPVIYAGVGPLRRIVAQHSLGHEVDWDAGQVADAMAAVLEDPVKPAERARLAAWVEQHYSLRGVGTRASEALAAAVSRS